MDKDLVVVQNNQVVTSSRKVAEDFGKRHNDVVDSIRRLLATNFSVTKMFHEDEFEYRGQKFSMFYMNRDGFSLLVMGFNGEKALEWKVRYIEQFNAMEETLLKQVHPLSLEEQMAQGLLAANKIIAEKNKQIEVMKPKALFADAVSSSRTSILIRDLAKLVKQNGIDIGEKRLFQWLRDKGYLIKSGSDKNMPTQMAMNLKLFEIKEGSYINGHGANCVTRTTKVTGKGQVYFVNKLLAK